MKGISSRRGKNKGPLKSDPLNLRPPNTDLPSGKIPNGIFLQAGLAVFAFRASPVRLALKQKHRSAFQVLSQAKQFACLGIKIWPYHKGRAKFYCAHQGTWSQVGSLTLSARDPASPCSPFVHALRELKLA
jgi:hypothetical protein